MEILGNTQFLLLLAAIAVVFLLMGIAIYLAGRAQTRAGRISGLAGVLLLAALLPAWGMLVFLLLASGQNLQDVGSVAPYMMIIAMYRFGGFFVVGALVAALAYYVTDGDHRAKWSRVQVVLTLLVIGMSTYVVIELASSDTFRA